MGCHCLLQGIFLTQGSNPGLPHCEQTLYHLSHQGSPRGNGLLRDLFSSKWFKALSSKFKWLINLELIFVFSGALYCVHVQLCLTLCNPIDCSPPDSTVHGIFPGKNTGVSCHFLLHGSSWPKDRPRSLALAGRFFTTAPPRKPSSVQFSHSVMADSLQPHELQHARPPCPSPTPGVYPNSCPLNRWCHLTNSSSVVPFSSCLQSFSTSGSSAAKSAAKSLQSRLTLCDPIDGSPPAYPVPGILQARTLEWVAISFSRGSSWPRNWNWVSCIAGSFFTD